MPESNDKQPQAQPEARPELTDKRTGPPGLMRKSLQTWAMLGLAFLILLLIWLTGGSKTAKPSPATQTPPKVQTGGVDGMTTDDLARRLADFERQNANLSPSAGGNVQNPLTVPPVTGQTVPNVPPQMDPIVDDQKKRAYTSLFSSSIALSYRDSQKKTTDMNALPPTPEQWAAVIANLPVSAFAPPMPASLPGLSAPAPEIASPTPVPAPAVSKKTAALSNQFTGKEYPIFEGTLLEAVLVNRLDGDFSGPVECMTTNDLYSQDRLHLLIPAGTRLLGQTKQVEGFGQRRLAIAFHRLIMPDGFSVDLDRSPGLDQIGETGQKDKVNNHYFQIFGAAIAIGALSGLAEAGTQTAGIGVSESSLDAYRQGVATSLSQSSMQVLDKFLNVLPTITIREGHRVKVYLTQDLAVPDYNRHLMSVNAQEAQ